jgi:putative membrane protein
MWEVKPTLIIALALMAVVYASAATALKRQPSTKQIAAYTVALLMLIGALSGPIDWLARNRLFSAYIFQQMLLIFVVPPLILLGLPDWMVRPVMMNRMVERVARFFTRPLVGFLTFAAVFTLIHYPPVCDRVCHVTQLYGWIRVVLLTAGMMLWWPLLSPLPEYPRMSYPMQIMYLFLLMIPMTAVAAPITLAESVLYMFYVSGPHPLGFTPMADQVLGGLIMWIGQGIYIMFVFTAIFARWSRTEDQEMPPINRVAPAPLHVLRGPSRHP